MIVSSVLHRGVYVHSVLFWLRSIPSGFYRLRFSTDDQLFKSNVFQLFIHNVAPAPSVPQPVSNLDNSRTICTQSLTSLLLSIPGTDPFFAVLLQADHVFNVASPIANSQGLPLSDLYFKTVPNFFFENNGLLFSTREALVTVSSSEGNVSLLSLALGSPLPTAWHLQTRDSSLLCVSNVFGGKLSLHWMLNGVSSIDSFELSRPRVSILSVSIVKNIPEVVPLSVTLNSTGIFTVNVTYRCDECALAPPICVCLPLLLVRAVKLDESCGEATISAKSSSGLFAFPSPSCTIEIDQDTFLQPFPRSGLCRFHNLTIDSATFGCSYRLEVVNPYDGMNVVQRSSNFKVCATFPVALSAAPLCSPQQSQANYSLFTWSGILLSRPPSNPSSNPRFVNVEEQSSLPSFARNRPVSLVVNLCGASVFSTTSSQFQPNRLPFFENNRLARQLQVDVSSGNPTRQIATCSLTILANLRCSATVVSGDCVVSQMPNGDTCYTNALTKSAFFCQTQFNPSRRTADLQLQLVFNGITSSDELGETRIEIGGSGSNSSGEQGRYWGFAPPQSCVLFCSSIHQTI